MAFDREAARAAGYSDEEIDAFLKITPDQPSGGVGNEPDPDEVIGSQAITSDRPGSMMEYAPGVAQGLGQAAKYAAYGYGAKKIYDITKSFVNRPVAPTTPVLTGAQQTAATLATPAEEMTAQELAAQQAQQARQAPASRTGNFLQRAQQLARQVGQTGVEVGKSTMRAAANPAVNNLLRGGGYAAALLTPGNVGQQYNFPIKGPLQGSEINPNTGRPWTQRELAAYNQQY